MKVFKGDYRDFPIIAVNNRSDLNKSLICGVGVNDADYMVQPVINGHQIACPIYSIWSNLLKRCADKKEKERTPTYKDAKICSDWLLFSKFRRWVLSNEWEGMQLDKDIILPGNKLYHPDLCAFIPQSLNKILSNHAASRGKYKQGVHFNKSTGKLVAQIGINGKKIHLGVFNLDCENEAHKAYIKKKVEVLLDASKSQSDIRVARGLEAHARLLSDSALT